MGGWIHPNGRSDFTYVCIGGAGVDLPKRAGGRGSVGWALHQGLCTPKKRLGFKYGAPFFVSNTRRMRTFPNPLVVLMLKSELWGTDGLYAPPPPPARGEYKRAGSDHSPPVPAFAPTSPTNLEYLLAVSKNLAHPLQPVYDDGKGGGSDILCC